MFLAICRASSRVSKWRLDLSSEINVTQRLSITVPHDKAANAICYSLVVLNGVPIKVDKSLKYQITIKRKAERNLRRYDAAIFGRPLVNLDQQLQNSPNERPICPARHALARKPTTPRSP
jgi:hypothetical protein